MQAHRGELAFYVERWGCENANHDGDHLCRSVRACSASCLGRIRHGDGAVLVRGMLRVERGVSCGGVPDRAGNPRQGSRNPRVKGRVVCEARLPLPSPEFHVRRRYLPGQQGSVKRSKFSKSPLTHTRRSLPQRGAHIPTTAASAFLPHKRSRWFRDTHTAGSATQRSRRLFCTKPISSALLPLEEAIAWAPDLCMVRSTGCHPGGDRRSSNRPSCSGCEGADGLRRSPGGRAQG